MTDRTELRRLLDAYRTAPNTDAAVDAYQEYREAAVNALPSLLDAATELAHMTEARDNARAEVERLAATVERVRALADRGTYKHDREHMGTHAAVVDGFARDILDALDATPGAES